MDPEQPKPQHGEQPENKTDEQPKGVQAHEDNDTGVNPYEVTKEVDYEKLLVKFGCHQISETLIERIEKITQQPAHRFIRRNIFYAHRDLDLILNAYEKHE